jgi:hypothetical protein
MLHRCCFRRGRWRKAGTRVVAAGTDEADEASEADKTSEASEADKG